MINQENKLVKCPWFAAMLIVFTATATRSDSLRQKFVGRSECQPELKIDPRGIRLDGSQKAYLRAYRVNGDDTLLIVQYKNDQDQCGVVRDVIQPKDSTNIFVWDCLNPRNPSAVVVGAWPPNEGHISGWSTRAWRVDLVKLQFIPISARVQSLPISRAGADDGSDLAGDAVKRRENRPQ
jgi:hypothetical protein